MRRECLERFPRHHGSAIPTSITVRAWRTRNPQFYVSGKRTIGFQLASMSYVWLGWYLNCNFIRIYRVAVGIPTLCEGDGNLKYTKNTYWTNLPPGQNGRNFADNILLRVQLKITQRWFRVKVMAWCRIGDRPLSEPMLSRFTGSYMRH